MMGSMFKGFVTGAVLGGSAALLYGVMNWQKEQRWCQKAANSGKWMAQKTDEWFDAR